LDVSAAIALEGGSTLVFEDGGRLDGQRARIEQVVRETIAAVRPLLPLDRITVLIRAGTADVIPELGIGGRADGGTVRVTFDPSSPALARSLDEELFPLLAHEMHHVARSRTVGYGSDLLGAMISEGLADRFSIEVAEIDPPLWSVALSAEEIETWSVRAQSEWFNTRYDHSAWFFGVSPPIPRWAGYTIGFELTGAFLDENPSLRASGLFAEPATSFIPAAARN